MATLITSIGTRAFDSTGESRLAERLEQKLHADYIPLLDQASPKVDYQASVHKDSLTRGNIPELCANWKAKGLYTSALGSTRALPPRAQEKQRIPSRRSRDSRL